MFLSKQNISLLDKFMLHVQWEQRSHNSKKGLLGSRRNW